MKLNYWFLAGLLAAIVLLSMIDFRTEAFADAADTTQLVLGGHPIGEPDVTVNFEDVLYNTFVPFADGDTKKLEALKNLSINVLLTLSKINTPVSSLSFETDVRPLISSGLSVASITAPDEAYNQIWDTLVAWNPSMPARVPPDAPAIPTVPIPKTNPTPASSSFVSPLPLPGFPSNSLEIKSTQPGTHLQLNTDRATIQQLFSDLIPAAKQAAAAGVVEKFVGHQSYPVEAISTMLP